MAAIASSPRVTHLALGEGDLGAELGIEQSPYEREWWTIRTEVLIASIAGGLNPPVGPVSVDFREVDALRSSTEALRRLGYRSRAAIHPAQVPVINEVFTPSPEEAASARAIVERYEAALAAKSGSDPRRGGADGRRSGGSGAAPHPGAGPSGAGMTPWR